MNCTKGAKPNPRCCGYPNLNGMQHRIMDQLNDSLRRDLAAGLPAGSSLSNRGVRIANIGQITPEAGTWVTASLFNTRCRMPNGSFIEAVRKRLAIPIMAIQLGQACAACAAPLETQGTHSTCCRVKEKSNRHTQIQAAVTAVVPWSRKHRLFLSRISRSQLF